MGHKNETTLVFLLMQERTSKLYILIIPIDILSYANYFLIQLCETSEACFGSFLFTLYASGSDAQHGSHNKLCNWTSLIFFESWLEYVLDNNNDDVEKVIRLQVPLVTLSSNQRKKWLSSYYAHSVWDDKHTIRTTAKSLLIHSLQLQRPMDRVRYQHLSRWQWVNTLCIFHASVYHQY